MKRRTIVFLCALLVCAMSVMGVGAYLKYHVLSVMDMGVEYNIVELPFLMLTDEALRYTVDFAIEYREELLAAKNPTDPPTDPPTEPPTDGPTDDDPVDDPTDPPTDPPTEPPTEEPTMPPTAATSPNTGTNERYPEYDYSNGAVLPDFFSDMLFIGDSRVVGLRDYARSGSAEYFCDVGMTVFSVTSKKCTDRNFSAQTLESLLASRTYGKIYIAFGINEAGYSLQTIVSKYQSLLNLIRSYQPDAIIILQSIMPVTERYCNNRWYFKPDHLSTINAKFQSFANGEDIFYADVVPYFADSRGYLYTNITGDGCHPTGHYYRVWSNWVSYILGKNGLDLEALTAIAPPPVDETDPPADPTDGDATTDGDQANT